MMIEDKHTSNIINGLLLFTKISSKTKVLSHNGAIDVTLPTSAYSIEELISLKTLDWEQLSDYSWRYWLEKKVSPWITLAGKESTLGDKYEDDEQYHQVIESIAQDRKELDEREARYYDEEYQIIEERMYDQ
jgi:hypothetical protein